MMKQGKKKAVKRGVKAADSGSAECVNVLRKVHEYPLRGLKSGGTLVDVKVFPRSKPGKAGFQAPKRPPKPRKFKPWFNYFVNYIGAAVEQLNAWQFNLDEFAKPAKPGEHLLRCMFQDELDNLATVMQIGEGHNPPKLIWPLSGVYVCDLELPNRRVRNPYRVLLIVSFEADADYQLVTNCSVTLLQPEAYRKYGGLFATVDGPAPKLINLDSSSSSSLATSSSSSGKQL